MKAFVDTNVLIDVLDPQAGPGPAQAGGQRQLRLVGAGSGWAGVWG